MPKDGSRATRTTLASDESSGPTPRLGDIVVARPRWQRLLAFPEVRDPGRRAPQSEPFEDGGLLLSVRSETATHGIRDIFAADGRVYLLSNDGKVRLPLLLPLTQGRLLTESI